MKTIKIYVDENKMIEGIELLSWYEQNDPWSTSDFYQMKRTFGNTANNQNICSQCTIDVSKDQYIGGLSYRKSLGKNLKFSSSLSIVLVYSFGQF